MEDKLFGPGYSRCARTRLASKSTATWLHSHLMSNFLSGLNNSGSGLQQDGQDSITLGQLKAMVGSAPKPKVRRGRHPAQRPPVTAHHPAMVVRLQLRRRRHGHE